MKKYTNEKSATLDPYVAVLRLVPVEQVYFEELKKAAKIAKKKQDKKNPALKMRDLLARRLIPSSIHR